MWRLRQFDDNGWSEVAHIHAFLCSPKVLVTLTNDPNKISHAINSIKLADRPILFQPCKSHKYQCPLICSIPVARPQHRQNLVQHQKIIVFVGSPLSESSVEYAETLKELGIIVDVIAFGAEQESNLAFLKAFIDTVTNAVERATY